MGETPAFDQQVVSRHWAETNESRAAEYRKMAADARRRADRYDAEAAHFERVAKADREIADA